VDITYLGQSAFRIKGKEVTLVTDPYDPKMLGFKFPKLEANIVTVSHDHGDHNFTSQIEGPSGNPPRVIHGPGEYEIKGVSVFGTPTYHDDKKGEERGHNTSYTITFDNINVCHLGDLGHKLTEEQVGQIGRVDILLIPVGGHYTINATEAAEVVSQLEPKIVIPMHYKADGLDPKVAEVLAPVEDFVKELGIEPIRDSKLTITYDKIPEEMQLVVLERKS
jgi:L-ascorbate metabolism protein UlaG (beta-lactamase superfamily)